MSAPLTPAGCDLRNFSKMMLDINRLRGSDFDAIADDAAWRAGLNLWMSAWHQVPAASLPDDELALAKAAGLGRDVKTWRKARSAALRGWASCDDGRLYHPTLAEFALEAWISKLGQRLSSGSGNRARHNAEFDPEPVLADLKVAAEHLRALSPSSAVLTKSSVRRALAEVPTGLPSGRQSVSDGTAGQRWAGVPSRSQENGTERSREGDGPQVPSPSRSRAVPDAHNDAPEHLRAGRSARSPKAPEHLRRIFSEAMGEEWARSYVDPCDFVDGDPPSLIPATKVAAAKLREEGRRLLAESGCIIADPKARAA